MRGLLDGFETWMGMGMQHYAPEPPPLRFRAGDTVEAKVVGGKWKVGIVTRVWDCGNPYRIRIGETDTEVHVPADDDRVVRAWSESAAVGGA
eukprot:g1179.t1